MGQSRSTDFDTDAPDVEFDISSNIAIEPDLLSAIEQQTNQRGIMVEVV